MASALKTLIVSPPGQGVPTATVFLIHGLGDTAQGWFDVAKMLSRRPSLQHVRFVLPTAPVQPVTVNMGMKMTSWFDLYSLTDLSQGEDEAGLMQSTSAIQRLVQAELDGTAPELNANRIPADRIVVGGFSQGGAIALLTGLLSPEPLAGVAALSTWLPLATKVPQLRRRQGSFPIFQAHGTADPIVDPDYGRQTFEALRDQFGFGSAIEFHQYRGMMHGACGEEIEDLGTWLQRLLPWRAP